MDRVALLTQLSQIPWLGHFPYTSRTMCIFKIPPSLALIKLVFISTSFVT